ncbi:MAG: acyltransferase family protein [Clostridiales bacterium]|nr:acyltransferase family protein [Clostridiales bacterium]
MAERRSKSNKKFMLLSALGIFMVVDHHTWITFNLFGDFIPYNSFFMPMFVFISGYFNKVDSSTGLPKYILKKIKTLLVPYVGISLCVFLLQQLINWIKAGEVPSVPSWYLEYALERIVTVGSFASIVEPMWFVISLFAALIVYAVLKKILYKIWNSWVMLALFCALHLLVVYLAKTTEPDSITWFLVPLKALFFLPFIEMGVIYRDHLEKKHSGLSGGWKIALLFVLLAVNMARMMYLPNSYDVAFDSINDLSGFTSPYIVTPLVSSLVGILFWLTLVDLVGKPVYESRFVNYMSCNTFWIMGFHILFFNILNCILLAVNNHIVPLLYFDVEAFQESEWYYWGLSSNFKLVYLTFGILGPLALKWAWDRLRASFGKRFLRNKA